VVGVKNPFDMLRNFITCEKKLDILQKLYYLRKEYYCFPMHLVVNLST